MGFFAVSDLHIRDSDGLLQSETIVEGGMVYNRLSQPDRPLIMDYINELRKNPGALRKLESMGLELTIPLADYYTLHRKYPDLKSPCAETRSRAWFKFMASAESAPYKVNSHGINPR